MLMLSINRNGEEKEKETSPLNEQQHLECTKKRFSTQDKKTKGKTEMKIILEFDNAKDARLALDAPKLQYIIDNMEKFLDDRLELSMEEDPADRGAYQLVQCELRASFYQVDREWGLVKDEYKEKRK